MMLSKGRFCCSSRSLPQEWVEQSLDEPRASHGGQAARAMRLCVSGSIGHPLSKSLGGELLGVSAEASSRQGPGFQQTNGLWLTSRVAVGLWVGMRTWKLFRSWPWVGLGKLPWR